MPGVPAWGWVDALKREERGFYSALSAGLPGCTAPHLQSPVGQAGSRDWEEWDSPPAHIVTLISVSPSLRHSERRFHTLQQSQLSEEGLRV